MKPQDKFEYDASGQSAIRLAEQASAVGRVYPAITYDPGLAPACDEPLVVSNEKPLTTEEE